MKITICDINEAVCDACRAVMPLDIEVWNESILSHSWGAVVSPANSFGFMDGGIDAAYTARFGAIIQYRVQRKVEEFPFGEIPVGEAVMVGTEDDRIPYLIVAPTMRVPMPIRDHIDILRATRIATCLAQQFEINSIAFPGMGTGAGMVAPSIAAKAMATGIRQAISRDMPPFPVSWREAYQRHINLEG